VIACVFLTYHSESSVEIQEAIRSEVGFALLSLTYRRRFLEAMGRLPQQLEMSALLTTSVAHFRLSRPRDLGRLNELVACVASRVPSRRVEVGNE
jgi:hypothetical protein